MNITAYTFEAVRTTFLTQNKGKGKYKKGTGKEEAHPQSGLSASDAPEEEWCSHPGSLMTGLPVSGLMILGLQLLDGTARELTPLGWRYPI